MERNGNNLQVYGFTFHERVRPFYLRVFCSFTTSFLHDEFRQIARSAFSNLNTHISPNDDNGTNINAASCNRTFEKYKDEKTRRRVWAASREIEEYGYILIAKTKKKPFDTKYTFFLSKNR